MTISSNDLDAKFKFEVAAIPGGEHILRCFACGTCTAVCPVSSAFPDEYDPRKIIHMILLGLKDRVLSSNALWYCSHCETCRISCPQNVPFDGISDALRKIAVRENRIPEDAYEIFGAGPCKAACPAHISIPGFVGMIAAGRYRDGLKLIKEQMPFPGICGRVCHHPCEAKCNRGNVDEPIAIEYLKRFLADRDLMEEIRYVPEVGEKRDEKVAVIGAGPAGLSAANQLAVKGYSVTVFDKLPVAGGMMAVGIPSYRLPREILEAEIQTIVDMGVEIRTGVTFGKDITIESLKKDGYNAFFIAVGLHVSRSLNVEGEDLPNIIHGIEFLKKVALKEEIVIGKKTIVIGGGNVAIDVALTALRAGAKEVQMACLESREEMPAWDYEIKDAEDEGIIINPSWGPRRFIGKDGNLKGLEFKRCTAVFDENHRFNPQYDESELMTLEADTVLLTIGQAVDMSFTEGVPELETSPRGPVVKDYSTFETNVDGLFVGGDASYGPRSVVEAVASGKEAAVSIDRYLTGQDIKGDRPFEWQGINYEPSGTEHMDRQKPPRLSVSERKGRFVEFDRGFDEQQAKYEADRCLRICGHQKKA